jgi:hypothetical protein
MSGYNVKTIFNPPDFHYFTPQSAGVVTLENAKQVFTGQNLVLNLYAYNSSGAQVYLAVCDTSGSSMTNAANITIYPIPATSFVNVATPGGDRFEVGLYLKAFTDAAATVAAGSVMAYKVDYDAYVALA